jgi:hypothetical protein
MSRFNLQGLGMAGPQALKFVLCNTLGWGWTFTWILKGKKRKIKIGILKNEMLVGEGIEEDI